MRSSGRSCSASSRLGERRAPVAEAGVRLGEVQRDAVLLRVVARGVHDALELVEPLERALEVALPGRQLRLGEEHLLEQRLVRPGDRLGLGQALPRLFHVLRGGEELPRRDARAHAHRRASPASSTRSMTRLHSSTASGAERTRRTAEASFSSQPASSSGARVDGIGEGDGARVVARRGLELPRLEAALAALGEVRRRALAVARLVEVPGDARRLLPGALAQRRLQRLPGRRVHLARGLVRQRVGDDLGDERRA